MCEREENIVVTLEAGAPGLTHLAFSSPQLLILLFVGHRKRAREKDGNTWTKIMLCKK